MKITISGFNGIYTGASIKPYVGMILQDKKVTKVNEKSILIASIDKPDQVQKCESFSIPFWVLSKHDAAQVMQINGEPYQPGEIEQALHILCQQDAHDATVAIAAIAEKFVKSGNMHGQPVSRFDGMSAEASLFAIERLTNY